MKFTQEMFRRYDESPDEAFYAAPRLVKHLDEAAIEAVTDLYREVFPAEGTVLDLMSSWVSHFPPEVDYARTVGLGLNHEELAYNAQLDEFLVQNLNTHPVLPYADRTFDGVGICVSVQYLIHPVEILREVRRVLKPEAPLVVTFSNRCFPTKAIAAWQMLDSNGQLSLVSAYAEKAGFCDVECLDCSPQSPGKGDPLYAVIAR
jgi:SAM-dependent methyltransferase